MSSCLHEEESAKPRKVSFCLSQRILQQSWKPHGKDEIRRKEADILPTVPEPGTCQCYLGGQGNCNITCSVEDKSQHVREGELRGGANPVPQSRSLVSEIISNDDEVEAT